ncbi:hypothetical protein BT63DRAFT_439723 [Microthyrium microscopicum]|uniref:CREG-like beta-barrel domain-containing protein n=1 Tax=Microthyrium microscopicum TaxID=703497 RepID=A0A6A6UBK2_9PEZI|nr:hypothetical protein BT63DRAFT_439723 [Microthyrium microscopicum]
MKSTILISTFLASSTAAFAVLPQSWKSTLPSIRKDESATRIPTIPESAAMARRILRKESIGTLSTVYNSNPTHPDIEGTPLGLMDYFADCEPTTGNPTLLGMHISSSFRNAAAGSNITLSIRWHPPTSTPYSAMSMPRFALIGQVERIDYTDVFKNAIPLCYGRSHPDAVVWMPGNRIHESFWMRLVVKEIYWLGGFGDRAFIGFIPLNIWQDVTEEDIENIRLPGEEDKEESSLMHKWFDRRFEF